MRITSRANFSLGRRLNRSDKQKYSNQAGNGYTYRYGSRAGQWRPL